MPSRNALAARRPSARSMTKEVPLAVQLRRVPELGHHLGHDPVRAHGGPPRALTRPGIRRLAKQGNHAQLLHQRRVERHFIQPIEDLARRARRARSLAWIDLDEDGILRVTLAHERRDRGVADITAVPVSLPVDLDRLEHRGQACRGEQDIWR